MSRDLQYLFKPVTGELHCKQQHDLHLAENTGQWKGDSRESLGGLHTFQPHYGPEVHSASNRNYDQGSSWAVQQGWRVKLTTSQPSVSRQSRKCGTLDVLQLFGPPRPHTETLYLFN
jgi:hypothetical protein